MDSEFLLFVIAVLLAAPVPLLLWRVLGPRYQRWRTTRIQLNRERLDREEAAGVPPSRLDYEYAIAFDADGFTVTNLRSRSGESWETRWTDVSRVTAYKRDLLTVDCICLHVETANGSSLQLDEEMARWKSFTKALPEYLPGCKSSDEWWSGVAFPPFAPNPTVLFDRATTSRNQ